MTRVQVLVLPLFNGVTLNRHFCPPNLSFHICKMGMVPAGSASLRLLAGFLEIMYLKVLSTLSVHVGMCVSCPATQHIRGLNPDPKTGDLMP